MNAVRGVDGNLNSEEHRRRFVECAIYFGLLNSKKVPNKSATILRLIDETWHLIQGKKTKRDPNFASKYGLKAVFHFGTSHEEELIRLVAESKYITIVGEDFGWVSNPIQVLNVLHTRLTTDRPTRIITPHPQFKPEPNREARIKSLTHLVVREQWDKVKASFAGNVLIRLIGVNLLLPYTAIMNEHELWIRYTLAATSRYKTMWVYEKTEDVENFYFQIEADLKSLEQDAINRPGWDLLERYRP